MLNKATSKYLYKGKKKKKRGGVKGEGKTAVCMLQFHWFSSPLSASTYIGCFWTERDERPAAANSRDSNDMVASQNCKSSCRVACIRLKILQPLDTTCWTTVRPHCLSEAGGGGENIYINIWRSNFSRSGLCKIKYQTTIFLNEIICQPKGSFAGSFMLPVLLVLLCHGTQIFL